MKPDLLAKACAFADTTTTTEDIELDPAERDFDFAAPAPPPKPRPPKPTPARAATGRTEKISIRIPRDTLAGIKARARAMGTPYQSWINRKLKTALLAP